MRVGRVHSPPASTGCAASALTAAAAVAQNKHGGCGVANEHRSSSRSKVLKISVIHVGGGAFGLAFILVVVVVVVVVVVLVVCVVRLLGYVIVAALIVRRLLRLSA